jgi:hypothetical protein
VLLGAFGIGLELEVSDSRIWNLEDFDVSCLARSIRAA